LFGTLFENILRVLEDDALNRAVVDLTILARSLGVQVDHEAAPKVIFDFDQVARELALHACNEIL